jgi:hypothetical protein
MVGFGKVCISWSNAEGIRLGNLKGWKEHVPTFYMLAFCP